MATARDRRAVINRQRAVRVTAGPLESFVHRLRDALNLGEAEVTICLVSDAEIARMNERFRKKRGPTDVLSFPASTRRRPGPLRRGQAASSRQDFLGDIAISPAAARRNALRYRRSLASELKILILHGTLHLLGYDHETDRGQMSRRERGLRRKLGLS
jgi:probable rRNA maturation factor